MGKNDNCVKCDRGSCELCSVINADPVDIDRHGAKLLTVRIEINHVCVDKKVAVACIIYDNNHRILTFRGFTTIVCKGSDACTDECGTIKRKLVFVLPEDVDPEELDVRTAANYLFPCE